MPCLEDLELALPHSLHLLCISFSSRQERLAGSAGSPHGNVVSAARIERSAMPVSPTVLQRHPIEAPHEIEFCGPSVAMHHRKAPRLAGLADDDLGGGQYLAGRVVVFDN